MSYFISDGFLDKKAEPLTIKGSAINSLGSIIFCVGGKSKAIFY